MKVVTVCWTLLGFGGSRSSHRCAPEPRQPGWKAVALWPLSLHLYQNTGKALLGQNTSPFPVLVLAIFHIICWVGLTYFNKVASFQADSHPLLSSYKKTFFKLLTTVHKLFFFYCCSSLAVSWACPMMPGMGTYLPSGPFLSCGPLLFSSPGMLLPLCTGDMSAVRIHKLLHKLILLNSGSTDGIVSEVSVWHFFWP